MAKEAKIMLEYVGYLREVLPLVASASRYPKLAEYEYRVAKLLEHKLNKQLFESKEYSDNIKPYRYDARSVHTQVWRAMQYLVKIGVVEKIGTHYYPAGESGTIHFQIFSDGIRLSSPNVHIISSTAYAITIEPNQEINELKSVMKSCLGEENLFGIFVQNELMLVLISPTAPTDLIAEFTSWVKDAYDIQRRQKVKRSYSDNN